MRVLLLFGRIAHQFARSGAQPLSHGLFSGRLVLWQRSAGVRWRGRFGDGRRPGRFDQDAGLVLWHRWHEGDPRPGALHRRDADRVDDRPYRPDDGQRQRQRADARGVGRARWTGPAPARWSNRQALQRADEEGRCRPEDRHRHRRLRLAAVAASSRRQGAQGSGDVHGLGRNGV